MHLSSTVSDRLGTLPLGFYGRIRAVDATGCGQALPPAELESNTSSVG